MDFRSATSVVKKLIYPAADRNKDPILKVIKRFIQPMPNQTFIEIASGTGQHVAYFASHFPQLTFYPSEYDFELLESISAHSLDLGNVEKPLHVDITTDFETWGDGIFKNCSIDYIYSANMIHISPFKCTIGLFKNAGKLLKPNGMLITYGPYATHGKITPESNEMFNKSLKSQNPDWGIRDIRDLKNIARENNIELVEVIDMPANNKTLAWKKN